jgi:hypothetical protein
MGEFLGQEEPIMLPTGSQRGGSFVNDYYLTGMFTVNYIMGSGNGYGSRRKGVYNGQCPTF